MSKFFRLGLTGYPLGHSRSPQLHHAALAHFGLEGDYRLFPIPPLPEGADALAALLSRLRAGELDGLNVTIPHKTSVLPHLDRLTPVAAAVGAANTLFVRNGALVGDNTDVPGFLEDLAPLQAGREPGEALVLGAGGSARSVVYALAASGWQVTVLARRSEQSRALVDSLIPAIPPGAPAPAASALDLPTLRGLAPVVGLIVNTTPLGMHPNPSGSPWPEGLPLPPGAAVYDLVYNPPITVLVHAAREQGLPARTGGGMLAAQAALAFSAWTGCPPPFEVMIEAMK